MVDIERKGLTLDDWTKGISVDEYAWWSYFYSEWIQSWYNTKWFKLGSRTYNNVLNSRKDWYVKALIPSWNYWMVALTYDWKMEWVDMMNENYKWAFYASYDDWSLYFNYLNWLKRGEYILWIRSTKVDLIKYEETYDPTAELITEPKFDDWWSGWTVWTGWTIWDSWAEHTVWETDDLVANLTDSLTDSDLVRVAIKITWCTAWYVTPYVWIMDSWFYEHTEFGGNGWFTFTIKWRTASTTVTITPTSSFDWTVEVVDVHKYDLSNVEVKKAQLSYGSYSNQHPAIIRWWDLYVWCRNYVNIVSLSDRWTITKNIVDSRFTIVAITQQAWSLILWATDWYDSKQYYWNWVDSVASEIIEWKWLIIKWVTGTETLSYVLTTAWRTEWVVDTYEYRLYAVSWYQRSLLAHKPFFISNVDFDSEYYHKAKKFEFNDVKWSECMAIFLDSLFVPWCDWIYKYWSDIPWVKSVFTRPIKYSVWAKNIVLWQNWNTFYFSQTVDWQNVVSEVNLRRYLSKWYVVTNSIYWDKLSTRKSLEKLKIWYKSVASEDWGINIYAIVDDDYFWRFEVSWVTNRPEIWDIYTVANQVKAEVISVDKINKIITFRTTENKGWYEWAANSSLSKVSWEWDSSITVVWFDNMCLVKEIKETEQKYGSDLIFGKDFVNNYMPYWHKMQLVIELYSIDTKLTPEVYEISIASDISDTTF